MISDEKKVGNATSRFEWRTLSRMSVVKALRKNALRIYYGSIEQEYRYSEYLDHTTGEMILRVLPVRKGNKLNTVDSEPDAA